MTSRKSSVVSRALAGLSAGVTLCILSFAGFVSAQSGGTIDAGTTITVRTNEPIYASGSDGRVFSGVVDQNVFNSSGNVAIPRGADVELLVKAMARNQMALDLESVTVNGERYGIQTQDTVIGSQQPDGLGANKRTGEFLGGGAAIGAIIGAIAGGGKGAAIGGGAGAALGAGTQVVTRGRNVNVPAESLVTFRLLQPLRTGMVESGYSQNGQHYHPGYGANNSGDSAAYRDGLQAGRSDSDRSLARNVRSSRWTNGQPVRDYQAGYNSGYDGATGFQQGNARVRIGLDNNISWQGQGNLRLYVQVDNKGRRLFAAGASGIQPAPWITSGHLYAFSLQDQNGNEIATDQLDLRQRR